MLSTVYVLPVVHFLALTSPGADFFYVISNSLSKNRKEAILSALGISFGIITWSIFVFIGVGKLLDRYEIFNFILPIIGSCYLFYLSYVLFKNRNDSLNDIETTKKRNSLLAGFVINVSNPKAFFYFTSIFSSVLATANISNLVISLLIFIIWLESLLWFTIVAVIFSKEKVRLYYEKNLSKVNLFLAASLIFMALLIIIKVFF